MNSDISCKMLLRGVAGYYEAGRLYDRLAVRTSRCVMGHSGLMILFTHFSLLILAVSLLCLVALLEVARSSFKDVRRTWLMWHLVAIAEALDIDPSHITTHWEQNLTTLQLGGKP